jgi:mRNA-degrading endonuclease RelE of RelBE toxin-antitoxin system
MEDLEEVVAKAREELKKLAKREQDALVDRLGWAQRSPRVKEAKNQILFLIKEAGKLGNAHISRSFQLDADENLVLAAWVTKAANVTVKHSHNNTYTYHISGW